MNNEFVYEIKPQRRISNFAIILPFHFAFIRPESMPSIVAKSYGIVVIGPQGKGRGYRIVKGII